ncbi:ricin-type beta-trefoil lectin domain protein [Streptomyces cinnamoneus]|uniref:RICIN domain-containing protein n=1 Tax=Streptomyces cinnamoneus TaxID=53446 RepID=UPI003424FEFA
MKKISLTYLTAAAVAPLVIVTASSEASAAGYIQWVNAATGRCLKTVDGDVKTGSCDGDSASWFDIRVADGDAFQIRPNGWKGHKCLDSNKAGSVYIRYCEPGNRNQIWYEMKTSTGWMLLNDATQRVLDSNRNGSVYTNLNEGDKNKYQRWH